MHLKLLSVIRQTADIQNHVLQNRERDEGTYNFTIILYEI